MNLELHPKQTEAYLSKATEILYGGAAGGGKSHLLRIIAISFALAVAGIQIYIFRRLSDDLLKNHMEGVSGFRNLLADWVSKGLIKINESTNTITFTWNGSKIYLCHCQYEKDVTKYQGAEIHILLVDELTHFTEYIYRFLRGRCRTGGLVVSDEYKEKLPFVLAGSNPKGIGHAWVKQTFIDHAPPMEIKRASKKEGGMLRQFIPSKLSDNPTMMLNDPEYVNRLEGLGNEQLVRAMLDGDWDILEGAYFSNFSRERHVIKPFNIPMHWSRICGMDWGYAAPFAVLWFAVSDGTMTLNNGLHIPKGALVGYREWYGSDGEPNKGLRLDAAQLAIGIKKRSMDERFSLMVADPAIFAVQTGISVAEIMQQHGVKWYPADNKRVPGWQQLHLRLNGTDESEHKPMIYFFDTCKDTIRTIPMQQHDSGNVEDLNSSLEDHCSDVVRYVCMTRPIISVQKDKPKGLPDYLKVNPSG